MFISLQAGVEAAWGHGGRAGDAGVHFLCQCFRPRRQPAGKMDTHAVTCHLVKAAYPCLTCVRRSFVFLLRWNGAELWLTFIQYWKQRRAVWWWECPQSPLRMQYPAAASRCQCLCVVFQDLLYSYYLPFSGGSRTKWWPLWYSVIWITLCAGSLVCVCSSDDINEMCLHLEAVVSASSDCVRRVELPW